MAIELFLTPADEALVAQMVELTRSERTEVIKTALTVYQWCVLQTMSGGHVVSHRPSGEQISLEEAEIAAPGQKARHLNPRELGSLANCLLTSNDPAEIANTREQLTRGFYGI